MSTLETYCVHVKNLSGVNKIIDYSVYCTFQQFKQIIADKFEVDIESFYIVYGGNILDEKVYNMEKYELYKLNAIQIVFYRK